MILSALRLPALPGKQPRPRAGPICQSGRVSSRDQPSPAQARALDAFADALYDLLHARAQSIGILDIAIEVNDWHVDGELLFANGPDLGFSLDSRLGECRYCELLDGDRERWLDVVRGDLLLLDAPGDQVLAASALELLDGLLEARRPLLRRD